MIVVQALLMLGVAPAQIRSYPLDERSVVTVRLSKDEPTTCVFPGPIRALVGANVSLKLEDDPGVLLSHQVGTEYFSLRSMKDGAVGALNVLFRGRVYPLAFTTGPEPDRAVVFLDEPLAGGVKAKWTAEALRMFLERAKQHARLGSVREVRVAVQRACPDNATYYRTFTATVREVFRFEAEDVLVFRVELANETARAIPYDPKGLAVRLGYEVFPAEYVEASGAIPAKAVVPVFLVVPGPGGRANLPVSETYNVIVPHS